MAEVIKTTFQLRRGNASAWAKNNPILSRGEPGFVIDENRLKIGDGTTAWNDLEYIGEDSIFDGNTIEDFPEQGQTRTIYKAAQEKAIYQWNDNSASYVLLSRGELQIASEETLGGVLSSSNEVENSVAVNEVGKMTVNSLNINKLVQSENEFLILYGGSATDNI